MIAMAVDLAVELGVIRVIVQMDSRIVAHALHRRKPEFSHMAVVIDDVKIQMGSWFSERKVQACRRQANKLTHEMAKVGALSRCLS